MDGATRDFVRRRAGQWCEYCHLPQKGHDERFSIDHIVPIKHDGDDSSDNLALSCLRCNLHKGTNLSGIDAISGLVVLLFHPRRHVWSEHFQWNGPIIIGLTPEGRATATVLEFNAPERVQLRRALLSEGKL
jgi:hypothetical protein